MRDALIMTFVSLLLCTVAAEGMLRLFFPQPNFYLKGYHPQGFLFNRPNFEGVVARFSEARTLHGKTLQPKRVWVRTNRDGHRNDRDFDTPSDRHRVLSVGDSISLGFPVDREQTYNGLLDDRAPEVDVINASMNWTSTARLLDHYRKAGRYLEPDVVIVQLTVSSSRFTNFLQLDRYGPHGFEIRHLTEAGERGLIKRHRVKDGAGNLTLVIEDEATQRRVSTMLDEVLLGSMPPLYDHLHGVRLVGNVGMLFRNNTEAFIGNEKPGVMIDATLYYLETFRREVVASGARFVVLTVPNHYGCRDAPIPGWKTLVETLRAKTIEVVDVRGDLCAGDDWASRFVPEDFHPGPTGHALIAERLVEHGVLEP